MKIGLIGYGRMGKAIDKLAQEGAHEVVLRIDRNNTEDLRPEKLQTCEVLIEFSQPASAYGNVRAGLEAGVPVVSGTTGWHERMEQIKERCVELDGAFLYASNFSIGVNVFFELNRYLARLLRDIPDYRVALTETHHIHKLDAPSGTALSLAGDILQENPRLEGWALADEATDDQLPITAIRKGEVPGTHRVEYHSEIDAITLVHTAHSRQGFARGALLAAEWIVGKKGVFEMADLLGWNKNKGV